MPHEVTLAAEGTTDTAVARRLLVDAGLTPGPEYAKGGKDALDRKLHGFNAAARHSCWLVLRDLDDDETCAPALRRRLLPSPSPHMRFQIAVRSIEAWLLADAVEIAALLGVRSAWVSPSPDALPDPKRHLLDLVRRSRRASVREAMLPAPGTSARTGPAYACTLAGFAATQWRPGIAATRSPSLDRLRRFLHSVSERSGDCDAARSPGP